MGKTQQLALDLLGVSDMALAGYFVSVEIPPAVVAQPISDVLDKLKHFIQIVDQAAKVHPYAKLAWDILSAAYKVIMAQLTIDQMVADLANTMQDVYSFVDAIEAVPSKIGLLGDTIQRIFIQTVECAIFIREYSGHGFAGRVLREKLGASTPAKVARMSKSLTALRSQFDTGVAVQIAMVSFRMHEDVTTLLKVHTLNLLGSSGASLSSRGSCLAGTRREIVTEIQNWALQPFKDDKSSVLWLYDVAGAGKSAVAATLATHFSQMGRLAAFMGFDRASPESSHPSMVVQAFAHQLALYDGRIGASIIKIINNDIRVLTKPLSEQFDQLIVRPLVSVPGLHGEGPVVVVLDALDECGQLKDRVGLLEVLAGRTKNLPSNLRLIITSRSIDDIREAFKASETHIKSQELRLACDSNSADITAYFKSRFLEIRRKNKDLQEDWPDPADIAELTARACGFFAWAVAVSDFIDAAHSPPKRLKSLLLREDTSIPEPEPSLDELYTHALASAGDWRDEDFVSDFRTIMSAIIAMPIPLSIAAMDRSLGRPLVRPSIITIQHLGALLTQLPVVRVLHSSFLDFLTNRDRCGRDIWYFEPGPAGTNTVPAAQCLQRMNADLKRNICNMSFSAPLGAEVLPEDLASACQSWVEHVCTNVEHQFWVMKELEVFLRTHLLHWFEAMSIVGESRKIVPMLERMATWLAGKRHEDKGLKILVVDAIKLVRNFVGNITAHPLHIYYTALPLHPIDSILYQTFRIDSLIPDHMGPKDLQRMNAGLRRNICNMAISIPLDAELLPKDLAYACQSWVDYICSISEHQSRVTETLDFFVRTHLLHWFEAMSIMRKSGEILPMLERVLAWLAENNLKDKSLELLMSDAVKFARSFAVDIAEHPLYVYYTALPLYPQNSILYQTFHDSCVDPSMCAVPLPGEDFDIAYTSDGRRYAVATGQERRGIAIRATATGQDLLKIATDKDFPRVTCVTFTDDGCRIAAGTANSAIHFWDSVSGSQVAEPLAHSTWAGGVCAVTWAADGEHLLSASDAGEMMLWNTVSIKGNRLSTMLHPDQCSGYINTLAFSSDGSQIASCSYKGHIFVWDPVGGNILWSVQIHQGLGTRVSFSTQPSG
ncbi:hypothetical protein HWV62_37382 [Athelia sp. TMB]|nr:hypothetical protein HWV62_37382 [Athelia sp. TMB]